MHDPIKQAQLEYLFEQLRVTAIPHALTVTITAGVLWFNAGSVEALYWCLIAHLSHVLRYYCVDRAWLKNKAINITKSLVFSMLLRGLTWSIIPLYFMGGLDTEVFLFCTIALAGVLCATLPAMAGYLPAYLTFALPILVSLSWRQYTQGMESTALLVLALIGAVIGISHALNQLITRSITMDLENKRLLNQVTQARDEAEQASLDKSRFLAAASHDLRQPLQGLGLVLESIRLRLRHVTEEPVTKNLSPLVDQAQQSYLSLSSMFDALMELSHLESRNFTVRLETGSLKQFVEPILEEFKSSFALKKLTFDCELSDVEIQTDSLLFGRIFRNLLNNAIKFTDVGGVKISGRLIERKVVLSVSDSGIGIPTEELNNIFKEYHQVSNHERNYEGGIGLGLSVVKKMCDVLGCDIEVTSTFGKGSQFSLYFPDVFPMSASLKTAESPVPSAEVSPPTNLVILVVEDNSDVLNAMSKLLTDWGNQCLCAENKQQALGIIEQSKIAIDLVISDYRLPAEADGFETIAAIRESVLQSLPAIMISGDPSAVLVKQAKNHNIEFITKPIESSLLAKVISRQCRGRCRANISASDTVENLDKHSPVTETADQTISVS